MFYMSVCLTKQVLHYCSSAIGLSLDHTRIEVFGYERPIDKMDYLCVKDSLHLPCSI